MKIFYQQLVKLRESNSSALEFRQNKYCDDVNFILSEIRISLILK